jgi:hypothetical protein
VQNGTQNTSHGFAHQMQIQTLEELQLIAKFFNYHLFFFLKGVLI